MDLGYLLRKLSYALRGYHYEEFPNGGYCVSNGNGSFGVSGKQTTSEPEE